MKPVTILKLNVGDAVRSAQGTQGNVTHFARDYVGIEWEGGRSAALTDADLAQLGVVKMSTFEAEDTIP